MRKGSPKCVLITMDGTAIRDSINIAVLTPERTYGVGFALSDGAYGVTSLLSCKYGLRSLPSLMALVEGERTTEYELYVSSAGDTNDIGPAPDPNGGICDDPAPPHTTDGDDDGGKDEEVVNAFSIAMSMFNPICSPRCFVPIWIAIYISKRGWRHGVGEVEVVRIAI